MHTNRKVKNYIINPRFQLKVVGYFLTLSIAVALNYFLAVQYSFSKFDHFGKEMNLGADHPYFEFITEQKDVFNHVFAVTTFFSIVIIILAGIVISHQVAGPLKKLHNYLLSEVKSKDELKLIKFRKGDFFPEIEDAYNRFIERIKKL